MTGRVAIREYAADPLLRASMWVGQRTTGSSGGFARTGSRRDVEVALWRRSAGPVPDRRVRTHRRVAPDVSDSANHVCGKSDPSRLPLVQRQLASSQIATTLQPSSGLKSLLDPVNDSGAHGG